MKIAQVSATFPPYMGGTGNVCYHNSIELVKLGHNVTVFTAGNQGVSEIVDPNIQVNRLKPMLHIGNAPLLPGLLSIEGFDLIHLHMPFFFGGECIFLNSLLKKSRYIVTYHNDVIFHNFVDTFLSFHSRIIGDKIFQNAECVCVTSMDFARNCSKKNVFRDLSLVELPNGVDINTFQPGIEPGWVRPHYNLGDKIVLLFVAALDKAHYFKGLEHLLVAFQRLDRTKYSLIVVGDGNLKDHYIRLSRTLGIEQNMIFAGRVPDSQLHNYYRDSDIVILPSTGIESFGMVLIEGMACGKPVIASNLPGMRTVVDDNTNGLLVDPGNICDLKDKIEYLGDNKEIRTQFGIAGRKKVEKCYSWQPIGEWLERIYRETTGI